MEYYSVAEGRTIRDLEGKVIGEGGDVIALATDSSDQQTRLKAEGVLLGQRLFVGKLAGKPEDFKGATKKKATKKKAGYKTTEATPEG